MLTDRWTVFSLRIDHLYITLILSRQEDPIGYAQHGISSGSALFVKTEYWQRQNPASEKEM